VSVVPFPDGSVQISTAIGASFGGEQFILWWKRGADCGGVESLAVFLNPPFTEPAGANVLTVNTLEDLPDTATLSASAYDTIDFEGMVSIGTTGAVALEIPPNILNVYFGPNAWVQGKLRFDLADIDPSTGVRKTRTIYGPGVLDVSRFNYLNRRVHRNRRRVLRPKLQHNSGPGPLQARRYRNPGHQSRREQRFLQQLGQQCESARLEQRKRSSSAGRQHDGV
jgi:hypothetical protein